MPGRFLTTSDRDPMLFLARPASSETAIRSSPTMQKFNDPDFAAGHSTNLAKLSRNPALTAVSSNSCDSPRTLRQEPVHMIRKQTKLSRYKLFPGRGRDVRCSA